MRVHYPSWSLHFEGGQPELKALRSRALSSPLLSSPLLLNEAAGQSRWLTKCSNNYWITILELAKGSQVVIGSRSSSWGLIQETMKKLMENPYLVKFSHLAVGLIQSGSLAFIMVSLGEEHLLTSFAFGNFTFNLINLSHNLRKSSSQTLPVQVCSITVWASKGRHISW